MSQIFTDCELQLSISNCFDLDFLQACKVEKFQKLRTWDEEGRVDWALTQNGLESKQPPSFLANVHHQPFYSTTEELNIQLTVQNQFRQTNTPKNSSCHELFQGKNFSLISRQIEILNRQRVQGQCYLTKNKVTYRFVYGWVDLGIFHMRHLWVNDLSLTLTLVFSAIALGVVCISRLEGQIDQLFLPCFSLFVLLLIVLSASFIYLNVFPPFILSTKIHSLRAYRIVFRYTAHFLLIKLYLPCVQASLKLIDMYRPNIRNNK